MQVEVHGAQPSRFRYQLEAAGEAALEVPILVGIELCSVLREDVLVGGDEKAAGAAGRIADCVVGSGAHDVYDALYERTGGEVLAGALNDTADRPPMLGMWIGCASPWV